MLSFVDPDAPDAPEAPDAPSAKFWMLLPVIPSTEDLGLSADAEETVAG